MAEGLARALAPEGVKVYSAGSHPGVLSSYAVRVMRELGIDISSHFSKGIPRIPLEEIDTVVTLCAEEFCPVFPHEVRRLHWPCQDPGLETESEEARLESFRRIRDQIRAKLTDLFR
jgi:arsenate reductase